jgi:hypothetical protein
VTLVTCKNAEDEHPAHPILKASLQIKATNHSKSAVRNIVTPTGKVELYIENLAINQNSDLDEIIHPHGPVGLFLVGAGEYSGGTYDNRGWYDITTSGTYTIQNDVNPYQYSDMSLVISKVRIDGVEIASSSTNDPRPKTMDTPVIIYDNTTEFIGILSMDLSDIYNEDTKRLIDNW